MSDKTEGNGVGVLKEPPVGTKGLSTAPRGGVSSLMLNQSASSLSFRVTLTDRLEVSWETLLVGKKLFVEIPSGILPEGSKESFVTLLEYAEEALHCSHVLVCFSKDRLDRASLVRTMMFLGFVVVAPGNHLVPMSGDLMFMAYLIEEDEEEEGSSDSDEEDPEE